jgi:hypothetical protein
MHEPVSFGHNHFKVPPFTEGALNDKAAVRSSEWSVVAASLRIAYVSDVKPARSTVQRIGDSNQSYVICLHRTGCMRPSRWVGVWKVGIR